MGGCVGHDCTLRENGPVVRFETNSLRPQLLGLISEMKATTLVVPNSGQVFQQRMPELGEMNTCVGKIYGIKFQSGVLKNSEVRYTYSHFWTGIIIII